MSETAIAEMIYDGLFDEAVAARLERLAAEPHVVYLMKNS